MTEVQYISDVDGKPVGVIDPIEVWEEMESEKEIAFPLKSERMRERLLEAKNLDEGIPLENVREKLGI